MKNQINNIRQFIKLLKKQRKGFTLNAHEKHSIKENLIITTEKHPVRNPEAARHTLQRSYSFFGKLQLNPIYKPMTAVLVITLIASLGGGVSFAAQDALPNEPLYGVKVHVNERVESALAFSDEAEADVQIEKAERRLTETERLAAKGELDAKTEARVEAAFEKHVSALERLKAKFEEKGNSEKAAEVEARMEAIISVHEAVLAMVNGDSEAVSRLRANLRDKAEAGARAEAEAKTDNETEARGNLQSATALMNVAEKRLEITNRFVEKHEANVSSEAQAQLDAAATLIAAGKGELESENYSEAFAAFKKSLRHTQKAHSMIATGLHLNVDVELGDNEDGEEENDEGDEEESNGTEVEVESETEVEVEGQTRGNETSGNARVRGEARVEAGL